MARRKEPTPLAPTALGGPPAELLAYPNTPEGISVWVPDDEPMPESWDFGGLAWWRLIVAHRRLGDARRAWCAERGLTIREVFHPVDPATGRRAWI